MLNYIMWSISKETGPAVDSNRDRSSEGEESDNNEEQCRTGDILDIESEPKQPHPKFICVAVTVSSQKAAPIESQLSSAWAKQQKNGRHCLESIVDSLQYLARQGLALPGHDSEEGIFYQHLKQKAK